MKYCIDTSALINLGERHYPERLPVFKPIWEHLYQGISQGEIISVDYVRIELEKKADDWRTNFLTRAGGMFFISDAIEKEFKIIVSEIESKSEFNANGARDRFMSGADPWLIALARNMGDCAVVSDETKNLANYGLGEVCKVMEVRHLSLIEFFEENDIGA